jgi:hypothetical protein
MPAYAQHQETGTFSARTASVCPCIVQRTIPLCGAANQADALLRFAPFDFSFGEHQLLLTAEVGCEDRLFPR